MSIEIPKRYEPSEFESSIYAMWEEEKTLHDLKDGMKLQKAAEEIDKAKNAIASLPDTSFKVTLNQIADLAIARTQ